MSRRKRSFAPGCVFHLTGRTSNRERWLESPELKNEAVKILAECVSASDIELIAFAIMSNHVHVLLRQGMKPLYYFAQPLFRRLARRIQLRLDREGHVFKGSFYDGLCRDVYHMRTAIDYIHHNPVDAGLCKSTDEYAWCSAPLYSGSSSDHLAPNQPEVAVALEIFASEKNRSHKQLQEDYRRYAEHRVLCRGLAEGDPHPAGPPMRAGDEAWIERFGSGYQQPGRTPIDLRDIVRVVIRDVAPNLPLELLRSRRGGAAISAVREEVVRRATLANHRGVDIATYLNVSEPTVSKIRSRLFRTEEMRGEARELHASLGQFSTFQLSSAPTHRASPPLD